LHAAEAVFKAKEVMLMFRALLFRRLQLCLSQSSSEEFWLFFASQLSIAGMERLIPHR
jgi:hypothetical protein